MQCRFFKSAFCQKNIMDTNDRWSKHLKTFSQCVCGSKIISFPRASLLSQKYITFLIFYFCEISWCNWLFFSRNHQRKLKITTGINCYKKRKLKFYDPFVISDSIIEMDNEIKVSLMENLFFLLFIKNVIYSIRKFK